MYQVIHVGVDPGSKKHGLAYRLPNTAYCLGTIRYDTEGGFEAFVITVARSEIFNQLLRAIECTQKSVGRRNRLVVHFHVECEPNSRQTHNNYWLQFVREIFLLILPGKNIDVRWDIVDGYTWQNTVLGTHNKKPKMATFDYLLGKNVMGSTSSHARDALCLAIYGYRTSGVAPGKRVLSSETKKSST